MRAELRLIDVDVRDSHPPRRHQLKEAFLEPVALRRLPVEQDALQQLAVDLPLFLEVDGALVAAVGRWHEPRARAGGGLHPRPQTQCRRPTEVIGTRTSEHRCQVFQHKCDSSSIRDEQDAATRPQLVRSKPAERQCSV